MSNWEIWIGYHHMGQGSTPPVDPEHVATVEASTFSVACLKYELARKLEWIDTSDRRGNPITERDLMNYYDFNTNVNSWTGPYFSSREDALKSFR